MIHRSRRVAHAAYFVLALAGALLLLPGLASWLSWRTLADVAHEDAMAWAQHRSPWQWTLRQPRDLVAGRVFGEVTVAGTPAGLVLRSDSGEAFEVGLPLDRVADLDRAPYLHVDLQPESSLLLQILVRERLEGPAITSSPAIAVSSSGVDIDLRRLAWTNDGSASLAPHRAAMLRLRIQLPSEKSVTLSGVKLAPDRTLARPSPNVPRHEKSLDTWLDQARHVDTQHLPWLVPPFVLRAENLLAWRDAARDAVPATIVGAAHPQPFLPAWASQRVAAAIAVIYLFGLLWLYRRPPARPRRRALLEAGGILAGPLWLIAGLHLGTADMPLPAVAFAAALVFATALAWRHRHDAYVQLVARGFERWLAPFALLPVAALACLLGNHTWTQPAPAHVLTYLAWALLQQWLVLNMVGRRLGHVWRAPTAIFVTALAFALLHTPNGTLMQLCMLAELWWAWCYRRSRNLAAIAIAHAACALVLEAGLAGGPWLRSLEVSARFFL
jgi:hypothetical protein